MLLARRGLRDGLRNDGTLSTAVDECLDFVAIHLDVDICDEVTTVGERQSRDRYWIPSNCSHSM